MSNPFFRECVGSAPSCRRSRVRGPGEGRSLGRAVCLLGVLAAAFGTLGGLFGCASSSTAPESSPAAERKALESEPWGEPDRVIAEVNGRPITRGSFYLRVLRRFGTGKLLSGIIKEELFFQEAQRRSLAVSSSEIRDKVDEIIAEMADDAGGETELARIYAQEGLTLAELRKDLEYEVGPQLLIGKVTKALRKVDDEALRTYYQQTFAHVRYRTRHIAYSFASQPGTPEGDANRRKLEAFNKALRAADRIRKGADFATLARAESEDQVTASRGGDLGFIHEDSPMDPNLRRAILELKADEVSEPVENPNGGYHVFQVTEVLPGQSFVDCAEAMRKELSEREPDLKEIEAALQLLRDQSDIRIFSMPFEGAGAEPAQAR